jgi:hypothetical protein
MFKGVAFNNPGLVADHLSASSPSAINPIHTMTKDASNIEGGHL